MPKPKTGSGEDDGSDAVRQAEAASIIADAAKAPGQQNEGDTEQQVDIEQLQKDIDAATGQDPSARSMVQRDPTQVLAELTDHIEESTKAQDIEITRLTAILTELRGQRAKYAEWIKSIQSLDANAALAEREAVAALQAAHFAKALMNTQRIT